MDYRNLTDEQIDEIYLEVSPDLLDDSQDSMLSEFWNEEEFTRDDVVTPEEVEETRNLHKAKRREYVENLLEKVYGS